MMILHPRLENIISSYHLPMDERIKVVNKTGKICDIDDLMVDCYHAPPTIPQPIDC